MKFLLTTFITLLAVSCSSPTRSPDYEPSERNLTPSARPIANPALGLANVEADKPLFDELNRRGLQCTAYHYPKYPVDPIVDEIDDAVVPPDTTFINPNLSIAICNRDRKIYSIQNGLYSEVENVFVQEGDEITGEIPVEDRKPVGQDWTEETLAYYEHEDPGYTEPANTRDDNTDNDVAKPVDLNDVEAAFDDVSLTMSNRSKPGDMRTAWAWVLKEGKQVSARGATFSWRSSNSGIASVSGSGRTATITANRSGDVTIYVSVRDPVKGRTISKSKTHYVRDTYEEPL